MIYTNLAQAVIAARQLADSVQLEGQRRSAYLVQKKGGRISITVNQPVRFMFKVTPTKKQKATQDRNVKERKRFTEDYLQQAILKSATLGVRKTAAALNFDESTVRRWLKKVSEYA